MKKLILLFSVIFLALSLSACQQSAAITATPAPATATPLPPTPTPTNTPIPPTETPTPTNTPLPPTETPTNTPIPPTATPARLKLISPALGSARIFLEQYTCDGENISPSLEWDDPPPDTQSFALIFDDPDARQVVGEIWIHWLLYNLSAQTRALPENVSSDDDLPAGSRQGKNTWGELSYGGPCPPAGRHHRYYFKLYALDTVLNLDAGATKVELLAAMEGHILAEGELNRLYPGQ